MMRKVFITLALMTTLITVAQEKYDIDKELESSCRITAPLHRAILPIGNFFLDIMPKGMQSDKELCITKHKVQSTIDGKDIGVWIITPATNDSSCSTHLRPCFLMLHGGGFVFKAAPITTSWPRPMHAIPVQR